MIETTKNTKTNNRTKMVKKKERKDTNKNGKKKKIHTKKLYTCTYFNSSSIEER